MERIKFNSIIALLILTTIVTGFSIVEENSDPTSVEGFPTIVFEVGDIVIGGPDGQIEWIKQATYCSSGITTQIGTAAIGKWVISMAFDNSVNLYASIRTPSPFFGTFRIDRFNIDGMFGETITQFPDLPIFPESIVFDTQDNFYLGTYNGILKNGAFIYGGYVAGLDLYCDQSTFLFTTAGTFIKKYSNNTSTIFAQNLGGIANDVRILPSGQVLLANDLNILLIKADGSAIDRVYSPTGTGWRSLAIESDAKHFICGSYSRNEIYRFNIEDGSSQSVLGGTVNPYSLAIVGGYTAASTGNNCGGIANRIDLLPKFSINPANTEDCITATVTDVCGMPVFGAPVEIRVVGSNQAIMSGITNASGQFVGCYTGIELGCDKIIAEVHNITSCSLYPTATAFKIWDDPLPVEMNSFTSSVNQNNVSLNWSTESEQNSFGFEIERRKDGNWTKIGFVEGYGTSSTPKKYSFTDKNLSSGNYFYRLRQIDFNGKFRYYELHEDVAIGIPDKFELSQNYPNPFNPTTKISYNLPFDGKVSLKIFDVSGKEVMSLSNEIKTAGYYETTVNGSNISSGLYFYRLSAEGNGQNFVATKKMMLTK